MSLPRPVGVNTASRRPIASSCQFTGREVTREAQSLVVVTARRPKDELFSELETHPDRPGTLTLQRIGDCRAPGIIAHAVYSGHRAARLLATSDLPTKSVAAEVGYESRSAFSRTFAAHFGLSPQAWRDQHT